MYVDDKAEGEPPPEWQRCPSCGTLMELDTECNDPPGIETFRCPTCDAEAEEQSFPRTRLVMRKPDNDRPRLLPRARDGGKG